MKRCLLLIFISALAVQVDAADPPQQTQEQTVELYYKNSADAANRWLNFVDQTKYAESWDTSSLTLKLTIPKQRWIYLMQAVRKSAGSLRSRKLVEQKLAQNAVGLPKGDYMVLLYDSSFSQKENAKELVTLVLESDGRWRVVTYQVS